MFGEFRSKLFQPLEALGDRDRVVSTVAGLALAASFGGASTAAAAHGHPKHHRKPVPERVHHDSNPAGTTGVDGGTAAPAETTGQAASPGGVPPSPDAPFPGGAEAPQNPVAGGAEAPAGS